MKALPTVMTVCVLITLLVLFALTLFSLDSMFYAGYHNGKQLRDDLNSAFVYYCNDSSFNSSHSDTVVTRRLYADRPTSDFRIEVQPWGLYERVGVSFGNDTRSTRLLGRVQDAPHEAALWLCSHEVALSLAGATQVIGTVYLPFDGINYMEVEGRPFSGETLHKADTRLSDEQLPAADSTAIARMDRILEASVHDRLTLSADQPCHDTIIAARTVIVEEGFVGTLQIVASDTVIISEHAHLRYPSGVYLKNEKVKPYLQLGAHSSLEGYAILFDGSEEIPSSGLDVQCNYSQNDSALFRGLLYVDGIADVRGTLQGGIYLKECYYLPPDGIYAGTIHDALITRDSTLAYPLLLKECEYRRREIKTLRKQQE
ncbi:MAG: hypothetical protein LBN06_02460 [Prevotellaceae bacterium]|jgi:hypothetical protein|nr:hypothetical protein [Prevotellaceae bacterium]